MEEDSYEKNVVMYVVIGEPKHLAGKFVFLKFKVILSLEYKLFAPRMIIIISGAYFVPIILKY